MKPFLKLVSPGTENRAVGPTRLANSEYRSREHLTPSEVEQLIEAAKTNRYGHRDATMLLVAFRHGLRASELCGLEWSQVDFTGATLHVRRVKNGKAATHPIRGDEMRALRKLQREAPRSAFVFVNERGTPFSPDGFNWLVKRAGQKAGLPFFRLMHTCCGIVRDTSSPAMATIRAPFRITSGIEISATRFDIRNCRRHGSRTFGEIRRQRL
jgi:type 1 fimbriae regulatory protein FimB/type 1 fimbriae regulatory protein FimE